MHFSVDHLDESASLPASYCSRKESPIGTLSPLPRPEQ
jgi:hypothetical protein